jgi:hypothetical protein
MLSTGTHLNRKIPLGIFIWLTIAIAWIGWQAVVEDWPKYYELHTRGSMTTGTILAVGPSTNHARDAVWYGYIVDQQSFSGVSDTASVDLPNEHGLKVGDQVPVIYLAKNTRVSCLGDCWRSVISAIQLTVLVLLVLDTFATLIIVYWSQINQHLPWWLKRL